MVDPSLLRQLHSSKFEGSSAIAPIDQTISVKYTAPAQFQSRETDEDTSALASVAAEILENPVALQQLSERVFELLLDDIQNQRERSYGYRGQR